MFASTLCIGADIHRDDIVLRLVDKATGHAVSEPLRVTNNLPGAQAAATAIAEVAIRLGYPRIEIAWEATGMLWIPFHHLLQHSPQLQPFELQLVCFNPQLVSKFKGGLVLRRPKNDPLDAKTIATRLRIGELPVSYVPGDFWQGLRRLTRYRFRLARNISREKMRFRSFAFLKYSDWKQGYPFSEVFGATSIALLTEYTTAQLSQMPQDQLVDLISRRGRHRFDDPIATARDVRKALRTSYPIAPQMDDMVTAALAMGWEHIRFMDRLTKRLDRLITRYIDPFPNPFGGIRGLNDLTDEFMAGNTLKRVISFHQFKIGAADSGKVHSDPRFARGYFRNGNGITKGDGTVLQPYRFHDFRFHEDSGLNRSFRHPFFPPSGTRGT